MVNKQIIKETSNGYEILPLKDMLFTDGNIYINEITPESANQFLLEMSYLSKTDKIIKIYINSPGGSVNAGLMIIDMIQQCKNEIYMYCTGIAASMAAIILAAGQKGRRFILPNSEIMIHEVLLKGGIGGSATSISKISKSIMNKRNLLNSILAENTGKTLSQINKATSFDNYMNAEEAVKFGICDSIVTNIFEN